MPIFRLLVLCVLTSGIAAIYAQALPEPGVTQPLPPALNRLPGSLSSFDIRQHGASSSMLSREAQASSYRSAAGREVERLSTLYGQAPRYAEGRFGLPQDIQPSGRSDRRGNRARTCRSGEELSHLRGLWKRAPIRRRLP